LNKKLIIIAGMHRSGTSAITGAIECLGFKLGNTLVGPHEGVNEKGYKEDVDVISLHEDMLWSIPAAWDDVLPIDTTVACNDDVFIERLTIILENYFKTHNSCAVKDPRICLFLPFWASVCKKLEIEPIFVVPARDPSAVARSLNHRDGMDTERAFWLWLKYLLLVERETRGYSRIFITYERFLKQSGVILEKILHSIGDINPRPSSEQMQVAMSFVNQKLDHSPQDNIVSQSDVAADCTALYESFQRAEEVGESGMNRQKFDEYYQRYQASMSDLDPVIADQLKSYRIHARNYRRYWNDCRFSRMNRLAKTVKSALGRQ
jgi:hypothetical protein